MMFIALLFHSAWAETSRELDYFLEQEIHILFSAYMHMQLAEKVDTGKIVGVDRFLDAKEFRYDDRSMITKSGSGYEIKVGEAKLCKNNNMEVVKCRDGTSTWNIERRTFGFTISQGGFCMTQVDKDVLKLRKCTDTDDQLFTFKIASGPDKCDGGELTIQDGTRKDTKVPDINIYSVSNRSRVEHVKSHPVAETVEYPVAERPERVYVMENSAPVREVVKDPIVVERPKRYVKKRLPARSVRTTRSRVVYDGLGDTAPYETVQDVGPRKTYVDHVDHVDRLDYVDRGYPRGRTVCRNGVCSDVYADRHGTHHDVYDRDDYLETGVRVADRFLFER